MQRVARFVSFTVGAATGLLVCTVFPDGWRDHALGAAAILASPVPGNLAPASQNNSAFRECVHRVLHHPGPTGASAVYTEPTDLVIAVMTTSKRHGLVRMLQQRWLKSTKVLFLTDAPGIEPSELHKVVVYTGDPNCGACHRRVVASSAPPTAYALASDHALDWSLRSGRPLCARHLPRERELLGLVQGGASLNSHRVCPECVSKAQRVVKGGLP